MAFNKKYEVYDRGALLGQYYADEVSELIGIPLRRVSAYAASGARFLRRYTIEAVDDTEPGWAEEWDRVRIEKLAWLRGGGAVGHKNNQKIAGRIPGNKKKADNPTSRIGT